VKEDTTSLADEQLLLGKKLANECICEYKILFESIWMYLIDFDSIVCIWIWHSEGRSTSNYRIHTRVLGISWCHWQWNPGVGLNISSTGGFTQSTTSNFCSEKPAAWRSKVTCLLRSLLCMYLCIKLHNFISFYYISWHDVVGHSWNHCVRYLSGP